MTLSAQSGSTWIVVPPSISTLVLNVVNEAGQKTSWVAQIAAVVKAPVSSTPV